MNKKPRVLYISSVIPDTTCGARLAIWRHLLYKQDFEVAVCSYAAETLQTKNKFVIRRNYWIERLKRTRFVRYVNNFDYYTNWFVVPQDLSCYVKEFAPDIIFTVPDDVHPGLAYQLSKKTGVPLVVDFQDLSPVSRFTQKPYKPFPLIQKWLLQKYRFLNKAASLAFYTSEGMQQWFGAHPNGHVLYPVGDFERPLPTIEHNSENLSKPVTIIYAGNCYGAYGRMLLRFAKQAKKSCDIHLKIFPVGNDWSDEDIKDLVASGIYQSFKPFEELRKDFQSADAFLTVMSFEDLERPFVETSFTTKWLDYAPYGKPIFVWAPSYSSAVKFAKKYECGIVVTQNDPSSLYQAIINLSANHTNWRKYSDKAREASENILNPELIHQLFVREIKKELSKGINV